MLGEPEASVPTGLRGRGHGRKELSLLPGGAQPGETHPHEVSSLVFQSGSGFAPHRPDPETSKSQPLLRRRSWSHTCSGELSRERRKTIRQAGKPGSSPFFFFFFNFQSKR